jgi:hypothetical protein
MEILIVLAVVFSIIVILATISHLHCTIGRKWHPCQSEGPVWHVDTEKVSECSLVCNKCNARWSLEKLYSIASGGEEDYMAVWHRDKNA